ncbi:MAG: hypothetical protein ABUL60_34700 [Myxococcales bacterium]
MLVGSAALAQQGLITEPWRKAAAPAAAPVPPRRAMPASGLGPAAKPLATPDRKPEGSPIIPGPAARHWSPPVVELLVDPWAKRQPAVFPGPRWVPSHVEIVDPWADAPGSKARVAARPASEHHSTIF